MFHVDLPIETQVTIPPSRRRISELAAEFLSAEYQPKKNSASQIKIEVNTILYCWLSGQQQAL